MTRNLEEIINDLMARGVRIEHGTAQAVAAGIGPYPDTAVGPVLHTITATWLGKIRFVADLEYEDGTRTEAADDRVCELADELAKACREQGVSLWWGSSWIGVGCWHLYDAGARWSRLAEEIRCTRIRALERPGLGHEQRLAELESASDLTGASR